MGKTCVKEAETGLAEIPRAPGERGPPLNSSNLQSHPSYDSSRLSCVRITHAPGRGLLVPGILPEFSFNFVKLCKVNTMTRSLQTRVTRGLQKLVRGCTVQNVDVREVVHPHTEFGGRIQETSRENSDHACQLPIATTNTSAHRLVNRKGLFRLTVGRFQAELGLGQGSTEFPQLPSRYQPRDVKSSH